MEPEKPVKIAISGKLTFAENITLSQAAQIVAFLDSSNALPLTSAISQTQPQGSGSRITGRGSAPRDTLDKSGAKTNAEKIVAFALHVFQEGGKDTFSIEDVKPLFRRAGESAPANMSRDLDSAVKSGWIAESDTKGEYFVTNKATSVLEKGFQALKSSRSTSGRTRPPSSKKGKKKSTSVPDSFRNIDEISPTIDGLIGYHKLTTKTDKFLWAVYAAKLLDVTSVTNQELVWLTDKLGDGIVSGEIAGNYRQNHKIGYVNRSTRDQKIRITPAGETYLKNKSNA